MLLEGHGIDAVGDGWKEWDVGRIIRRGEGWGAAGWDGKEASEREKDVKIRIKISENWSSTYKLIFLYVDLKRKSKTSVRARTHTGGHLLGESRVKQGT
jgi:hypothetical protein